MRKPSDEENIAIQDMMNYLLPELFYTFVTDPARMSSLLPETVGRFVSTAILYALQHDDENIRRETAESLWASVLDRREIHNYEGFRILCDLLNDNYDYDEDAF